MDWFWLSKEPQRTGGYKHGWLLDFFQAMSLSPKNSPRNLQGLWSVPACDTHPTLVITNNPNAAIRLWWEKLKQERVK
jgi:hypothetical protein